MTREFWRLVNELGQHAAGQRRKTLRDRISIYLNQQPDPTCFILDELQGVEFGECDDRLRGEGFAYADIAQLARLLDNPNCRFPIDTDRLTRIPDPELRCVLAKKSGVDSRSVPFTDLQLSACLNLWRNKRDSYCHSFAAMLVAHMRDHYDPCSSLEDGSFWRSWEEATQLNRNETIQVLRRASMVYVRHDRDWLPFGVSDNAPVQDLMSNAFPLRNDAAIRPLAEALAAICDAGSPWSEIAALSNEELSKCLSVYAPPGLGRLMWYCHDQLLAFSHDLLEFLSLSDEERSRQLDGNDPAFRSAVDLVHRLAGRHLPVRPRLSGWCTNWRWTPATWESGRGYWSLVIQGFRLNCSEAASRRLSLRVLGQSLTLPYVLDNDAICIGTCEVPNISDEQIRQHIPGPVPLDWEGLNRHDTPPRMGWVATLAQPPEAYDVLVFRQPRRGSGALELVLPDTELPKTTYTVAECDGLCLAIRRKVDPPEGAMSCDVDLPGNLVKTHRTYSWDRPTACDIGSSVHVGLRSRDFEITDLLKGCSFLASGDNALWPIVHEFPGTNASDAVYWNGALLTSRGAGRPAYGRYQVRRRRSRTDFFYVPRITVTFEKAVFQMGEAASGAVRVDDEKASLSWAGTQERVQQLTISTEEQSRHLAVWYNGGKLADLLLQLPRFEWGLRREDGSIVEFRPDNVVPSEWLTAGARIVVTAWGPPDLGIEFPDIDAQGPVAPAHLFRDKDYVSVKICDRPFSIPIQKKVCSFNVCSLKATDTRLAMRATVTGLPAGQVPARIEMDLECPEALWRRPLNVCLSAEAETWFAGSVPSPLPQLPHRIKPDSVRVLSAHNRRWTVTVVTGETSVIGSAECPWEALGTMLLSGLQREAAVPDAWATARYTHEMVCLGSIPEADRLRAGEVLAQLLCWAMKQCCLEDSVLAFARVLATTEGTKAMVAIVKEELIGLALLEGAQSRLIQLAAKANLSLEDVDLSRTRFSVNGENPLWDVWMPLGCFAAIRQSGWNAVAAERRLGHVEVLDESRRTGQGVTPAALLRAVNLRWIAPHVPPITQDSLEEWQGNVVPAADANNVDQNASWDDCRPAWIGQESVPALLAGLEEALRPRTLRNGSCRGQLQEWVVWAAFAHAVQMRLKAYKVIRPGFRKDDQLRSGCLVSNAKELYERMLCLVEAIIVWKIKTPGAATL